MTTKAINNENLVNNFSIIGQYKISNSLVKALSLNGRTNYQSMILSVNG